MKTYTISEAQRNLPTLLEEAEKKGYVVIHGDVGQAFVVKPQVAPPLKSQTEGKSPLDVKGVDLGVTTEEIVDIVRESREIWSRKLDERERSGAG
jgi:hypothetical protein